LTVLFLSALTAAAQEERFQWKGLSFETSSIQDTIKALGKPKKDKIEKAKFDSAIPSNVKGQMNFRKLQYKNIDDFDEVYLLFLNEKLVGFEFSPEKKKILATDLSKLYNADFLFMEGIAKGTKLTDFEGQKETTVPKVYPGFYFMLTAKPDSAIVATIDNNTWKALWRDAVKKPTVDLFPGYVSNIQIFSRSFEGK
jgi:hypothetical protein